MPKYMCKLDASDTPSEVDAFDEEESAETFVEGYCAAISEWPWPAELEPAEMEVLVDDVPYIVTIEAVPKFSARKK